MAVKKHQFVFLGEGEDRTCIRARSTGGSHYRVDAVGKDGMADEILGYVMRDQRGPSGAPWTISVNNQAVDHAATLKAAVSALGGRYMATKDQPRETHVRAQDAPLGVLLWSVRTEESADAYTLSQVSVIRREGMGKPYVEWVYRNGNVRAFDLDEQVVIQANAQIKEN